MADFGRASSFLPTIKCSMCAADIEISQMGDHICGGGERRFSRKILKAAADKILCSDSSARFIWQL
jgi:hypothetical protein